MSYDLNFWKYKKGIYLDNHEVYEKCSDQQTIEGLENLPIELILKDIKNEFITWKIENSNIDFKNPKGKGAFQIFNTKQFIRFDCYKMELLDLNRIIRTVIKYDCPLYDSQVSERFDGK